MGIYPTSLNVFCRLVEGLLPSSPGSKEEVLGQLLQASSPWITKVRTVSLKQFAAECEVFVIRVSFSKSGVMVLCQKMVDCPLQLVGKLLPQVKEFKYLRGLFTSDWKMEQCSGLSWCRGS